MRLRQAYRRDTALTLDKVFRLNHETRKDDKVQYQVLSHARERRK